MDQLARVKDLPVPEFGSLQAWELQAGSVARGAGDLNGNDPSKSSQGGTPMPFVGETKVAFNSYIFMCMHSSGLAQMEILEKELFASYLALKSWFDLLCWIDKLQLGVGQTRT